MYKILFSLCLLFCFSSLSAQDTLTLTSGRQLIVNIVSVETKNVKYKRLNDEFGSNYLIDKRKLSSIKYKNGTTENMETNDKVVSGNAGEANHLRISGNKIYMNGVRISRLTLKDELSLVPRADREYHYARTNNAAGILFGIPAGLLLGWQLSTVVLGGKPSLPVTAIGTGLFITSIVLDNACKRRTLDAISIYNDHHVKRSVKIDFGLNSGGLGFAMKF